MACLKYTIYSGNKIISLYICLAERYKQSAPNVLSCQNDQLTPPLFVSITSLCSELAVRCVVGLA